MKFIEYLLELQSDNEITMLDHELDKLFRPLGIDVRFTNHFKERLLGRERKVTGDEVYQTFQRLREKYNDKLKHAKKTGDYTAVLKDFSNELNIVFSIDNPHQLDAITIMQKDPSQFHVNTRNSQGAQELRVGKMRQQRPGLRRSGRFQQRRQSTTRF
jgi:hypothetical protein